MADVEDFLRDWMATAAPGVTVIAEPADGLPADLAHRLPLIAISRFGGADDIVGIDTAHIDVDTYASTYDAAKRIAASLHQRIRLTLPGHHVPPLNVLRVRTMSAPVRRPWQAAHTYRVGGTYEITVHARQLAT